MTFGEQIKYCLKTTKDKENEKMFYTEIVYGQFNLTKALNKLASDGYDIFQIIPKQENMHLQAAQFMIVYKDKN